MEPPKGYAWRDRDAAHRMRDEIALHQTVLSPGEIMAGVWVVIRLSDGTGVGQTYPTQAEAIKHAPGLESLFAYFKLPLERMPAEACDVMLAYVRQAYDNGWRPDPERGNVALVLPSIRDLR